MKQRRMPSRESVIERLRTTFAAATSRARPPRTAHLVVDEELSKWCRAAGVRLALPKIAAGAEVAWNPRMRTSAGRAFWPALGIELNPLLHQIGRDEIWRTLKHELAHLIAYERAGRRRIEPHGSEWRAACAELGIAGEAVRHTLPFVGRKMARKFAYACPGCARVIRRARVMQRKAACHACCVAFSGGRYDSRFCLRPVPLAE